MFEAQDQILNQLRAGEDGASEFKTLKFGRYGVVDPAAESIAGEMVAFANATGGTLFLGVGDDGQVEGIGRDRQELVDAWIANIAAQNCEPPIRPTIRRQILDGSVGKERTIVLVDVPRGLYVHRTSGGRHYLRVGSSKRGLRPPELARLFQERGRDFVFDEQPANMAMHSLLRSSRAANHFWTRPPSGCFRRLGGGSHRGGRRTSNRLVERLIAPFFLVIALAGCSGGDDSIMPPEPPEPPSPPALTFQAEIRRTEYGIPHIKANDWGSLGYGYGYAYAQDNFCVAMLAIVFSTSRSGEFFGEQRGDLVADFVLRLMLGTKEEFRERFLANGESDALLLVQGFAAGMNRYLRETGVENLPEGDAGCRNADWVYELDAVDVWMHIARIALAGSSDMAIARSAIFAPKGPDGTSATGFDSDQKEALSRALRRHATGFGFGATGSNALAVGRDFSQTGKGLLLGNPHRGWSGPGGFHQLHLTIPGDYDVAGAALQGVPLVGIGFNGDLAWTHTTSFAARFTLYELQLNPQDPMQYNYEGEWRDITTEEETIRVKREDGSLAERTHRFYLSHYGPIVSLGEITDLLATWPLANGNLLTLRDANVPRDIGLVEQYLNMGRARTLEAFTDALKPIGNPVFHTFAAHRDGEVFYGDVSGIPHVTGQQLDDCATDLGRLLAAATNDAAVTLDGSATACEWGEDADSPPGSNLYGFAARPKLTTTDYVGNGNDSYWLSNADNPLVGFPIVFGWLGHENSQQSLRTRIGHLMVRERRTGDDGLDAAPGFTLDSMKALMYRNRVYGAEIVLDDVLSICADFVGADASEERAKRACAVLADWDRSVQLESRGAQVFTEFWRGVHRELGNDFNLLIESRSFWDVDFDAADPLNTPRGIDLSRSRNLSLVASALGDAVATLDEAGITLDAPWRDVQFATRNGNRIPIHGGDPEAGVYGAISAQLGAGGYTPRSGNSYLQAVTWTDEPCPVADSILVPSQSSDPESAHYADQTELYSRKQWLRFPYCEEEIAAAQIGETLEIEE